MAPLPRRLSFFPILGLHGVHFLVYLYFVSWPASGASANVPLCVEFVSSSSTYHSMVPHPNGSATAFFLDESGLVYLSATPPSGAPLQPFGTPYLNLTQRLAQGPGLGLRGVAFHPDFNGNGRLFASYVCNSSTWSGCALRARSPGDAAPPPAYCPCNADPTLCPGAAKCTDYLVVDEFNAFPSEGFSPSTNPSEFQAIENMEVRRVLAVGEPLGANVGGQAFFGPDGMLYAMLGDGGVDALPLLRDSPLGKLLRVQVDNFVPSPSKILRDGLLGEYSLPPEGNVGKSSVRGATYAAGFRSPSGCTYDPTNTLLLCVDSSFNSSERVYSVIARGEYGCSSCKAPLLPAYTHVDATPSGIVSGQFVDPTLRTCIPGRYLFGDASGALYAAAVSMATGAAGPTPTSSGLVNVTVVCSKTSPVACPTNLLRGIESIGVDNNKTVYIFTRAGVYRVVGASSCGGCSPSAAGGGTAQTGTQSGSGSGGTGSTGGGSRTSPAGPASPTTSPSTTQGSGGGSGGGSNPSSHPASYWIKLAIIMAAILSSVCGVCCFCLLRGYREGKKRDEKFLELQMAEGELLQRARDGAEGADGDEVYHPDGGEAGGSAEDGATVTDDDDETERETELDDSMTEYSSRQGPASSSGGSASTRDVPRRGGGYAESEVGSEYTTPTVRSDYTGYTAQTPHTGMTRRQPAAAYDARSYTTRDDVTETASAYGYQAG